MLSTSVIAHSLSATNRAFSAVLQGCFLGFGIREALGVFGRTAVVIEVVGEKAEMTLASLPRLDIRRKGGRTVYSGPIPAGWDSGEAVDRMRQQRVRR